MHLREAEPADAGAIAAVRVAGWRYAYAGVMPQAYLDSLSEAEDAARHRERLARPSSPARDLLVTDDDGTVAGWASCGPYRVDGGTRRVEDAELYALYVRPDRIGTGLGRLLTDAVRDAVAEDGAERLFVWVVEENVLARRFYERAGFAADGGRDDFTVGGRVLSDLRYVQELQR